jgi:dipeptidyl aminopeptidase/acylaminoacyl peptidase
VADNDPGHVAGDEPILVVHSTADDTVPLAFSQALVDRMRGLGQTIELRAIDRGEGHVAAMDDAAAEGLAWLGERLSGVEGGLDTRQMDPAQP